MQENFVIVYLKQNAREDPKRIRLCRLNNLARTTLSSEKMFDNLHVKNSKKF